MLHTAKSPSVPFSLTSSTGPYLRRIFPLCLLISPHSGMRGLPALVWDGSVLDPGMPRLASSVALVLTLSVQRRVSASVASLFLRSRQPFPRPPAGPSPFPKVSSGFSLLARSPHRSKSLLSPRIGPPVPPSPHSWRRSSTAARLRCTPCLSSRSLSLPYVLTSLLLPSIRLSDAGPMVPLNSSTTIRHLPRPTRRVFPRRSTGSLPSKIPWTCESHVSNPGSPL